MPPVDKSPKRPNAERDAKLAQALRANLKRRKAGLREPTKAAPVAKTGDDG